MKVTVLSQEEFVEDFQPNKRFEVEAADIDYDNDEITDIVGKIAKDHPSILVIGPDISEEAAIAVSSKLRESNPEIETVAYGDYDSEFLPLAMKAGFRDVVSEEEGLSELDRSLTLLADAHRLLENNLRAGGAPAEESNSNVICFFGPKGGTGKTTLAVNVAYQLAQIAPNEVVLVDLDLVGGEVGHLLQIESSATVGTVATQQGMQDPTALKLSLSTHPAGFSVLPAPNSFDEINRVDDEATEAMLETLAESFKYVVLDTGPGSSDATIAAVQACTELVSVITPEIGGLRILQRHIEGFDQVGLVDHRRHFILNKDDPKSGMGVENVEVALARPVSLTIPVDRAIPIAGNQGVPYLETKAKGGASDVIRGLAMALSGREHLAEAPQPAKSGWFSKG